MLSQGTYEYRCQNVKKYFLASILNWLSLNFIESLFLFVLQARRNNKTEKPCDLLTCPTLAKTGIWERSLHLLSYYSKLTWEWSLTGHAGRKIPARKKPEDNLAFRQQLLGETLQIWGAHNPFIVQYRSCLTSTKLLFRNGDDSCLHLANTLNMF